MKEYTVTGPDCDRRAESSSVGLSIAVTYACRASRVGTEASYYVRGPSGLVVGRADALGDGSVRVLGEGSIEPYTVSQTPDPFDRAATSGADPLVAGRSGSPRPPTKEEKEMATEQQKPRSRARKPAGEAAAPAPAAAKAPAKQEGEKGTDLLAALMQSVEQRIEGVEPKTNKSQTSTRLVKDGKTFAVVFPPRSTGLAVKIPKQLLAVEAELPKDHGFHRVGWGLSRTITKASEVPSVVKSFAVAAAAAAPAGEEGGS